MTKKGIRNKAEEMVSAQCEESGCIREEVPIYEVGMYHSTQEYFKK